MRFLRDASELPTNPSLEQFWNVLCRHDWYFQFSDDFSVWKRGAEIEKAVLEMAKQTEIHQQLYDTFHTYNFSGGAFGTKQTAAPQKSDFNIN